MVKNCPNILFKLNYLNLYFYTQPYNFLKVNENLELFKFGVIGTF